MIGIKSKFLIKKDFIVLKKNLKSKNLERLL